MIGKILDIGIPTANDTVYPKDVVEKMMKKYKEDFIDKGRSIIFSTNSDNLDYAYGLVKDYEIRGGSAYIDFKQLSFKPEVNEKITEMIEGKMMHCVTAGMGTVKDGVVQDDYQLRYIFLDPEPSYKID